MRRERGRECKVLENGSMEVAEERERERGKGRRREGTRVSESKRQKERGWKRGLV